MISARCLRGLAVATERQLAANRANAKKSTGPKTAMGKLRSSQNAYRHGLSLPSRDSPTVAAKIAEIVQAESGNITHPQASELARALQQLAQIREVRSALMAEMVTGQLDILLLQSLAPLDRYERVARTKRRRAINAIKKMVI